MKLPHILILSLFLISTLAGAQERAASAADAKPLPPAPAHITLPSAPGYTGFTFSVALSASAFPQPVGYTIVSGVEPGSPAAKAGFAVGDVLIEANGVDLLKNSRALFPSLVGVKYLVRVKRGGEEKELTLVPIEFGEQNPKGTPDRR